MKKNKLNRFFITLIVTMVMQFFSSSAIALLNGDGLKVSYWNYSVVGNTYNFPTSTPDFTAINQTVDFNWGTEKPVAAIDANRFAISWEGSVETLDAGNYTFHTQSDDGVRLWVNNQLVIDNWTRHGAAWNSSSSITLAAGTKYDIKMEFFEHGGRAVARLHWKTPSNSTRRVIPQTNLHSTSHPYITNISSDTPCLTSTLFVDYNVEIKAGNSPNSAEKKSNYSISPRTPAGLGIVDATIDPANPYRVKLTLNKQLDSAINYTVTVKDVVSTTNLAITPNPQSYSFTLGAGVNASYWSGISTANSNTAFPSTSPTLSRIESNINNNWGSGSPDSRISNNKFAARWEGGVVAPSTGSYTFSTRGDDGIRLWIDGDLVVDDWSNHSARYRNSAPVLLTAGQTYSIKVEYFESSGGAVAQVFWSKPTGGGRKIIPPSAFTSCSLLADNDPSNFNCFESSTVGGAVAGLLHTKLAGTGFSIHVVALQDNPASTATPPAQLVLDDFESTGSASGAVTVELVDGTAGDGSCMAYPRLDSVSHQSLAFVTTDLGRKTTSEFNSAKAYKNVRCRVNYDHDSDSATANITGCSADTFAIRPTDFTITAQKSDNTPLNNATSSGELTETAGDNFTLIADTNTVNYDGIPVIDNDAITAHSGFIQTGTLAGSFSAADILTGNSIGRAFTYSEVGNFTINEGGIVDSDYTAVDQFDGCIENSVSTMLVNGMYGCNIANSVASHTIGRFIPAYFKVTSSTQGTFTNECIAGGFTYTGQEFTYDIHPSLTLAAYNGYDDVTQNYTGDYNNLIVTDFDITDPIIDKNELNVIGLTDGTTKARLSWDYPSSTPTLNDNGDGSLAFILEDDKYIYTHEDNNKIAPFTPEVKLDFIDITDSDGVVTKQTDPADPSNLILLSTEPYTLTATGSQLRYGRLVIDNAYGSELAPLAMPMYTEYYNGSDFVRNTDDSCTAITTNQLLYNSVATNPVTVGTGTSTASIANVPFSAGFAGLEFSAPGEGNSGFVVVEASTFIIAFPWLEFDWNGDGTRLYPEATATFGLFSGSSKQIFFREVY